MSGGVEWALHCCTVLSTADQPVPAARLAEYHDVSPTYLAKQLQALSRAGLVHSTHGHAGGYALTRSAEDISVLEVVEAVDGARPAFVCTEIRQRGPRAMAPQDCVKPCGINRVMGAADAAWRASLAAVSIADLGRAFGPVGLQGVRTWLTEAAGA
jgi:Rrf2 family protein